MTNKISNVDTRGVDGRPAAVSAGAAAQRARESGNENASASSTQTVEGVQITDAARQLASLERALADVPAVSQERVDKVARELSEGRYQVRAEKIADKILRMDQSLADARRGKK